MLLSVVNDVLDFSQLEAGQLELDPQPLDPSAFFADTLDLVIPQASSKHLDLECLLDDTLPARILVDNTRLRQVLLNLLGNAIKFTSVGGITVRVGYRADEGQLSVSLTDTGPGISPEAHARLFQRFSQVDGSNSRDHGGTGLGLAICKSLVELMGGAIGVESVVGQGSTFWFHIAAPIAEVQGGVAAACEDDDVEAGHVLVVDDVPVNRELVRIMLEPFGLTVEEAEGGAEAVEAALRTPFDLILMDLQMPGIDETRRHAGDPQVGRGQSRYADCGAQRQCPSSACGGLRGRGHERPHGQAGQCRGVARQGRPMGLGAPRPRRTGGDVRLQVRAPGTQTLRARSATPPEGRGPRADCGPRAWAPEAPLTMRPHRPRRKRFRRPPREGLEGLGRLAIMADLAPVPSRPSGRLSPKSAGIDRSP